MLTLYQFPRYWGMANISPFCMKLETYLRLSGIPYEVHPTTNMGKAPKRKLPYIRDGATVLCDTSLIIEALKKKHGDTLDSWLSPLQKAQGFALQRLLEEHFYFAVVYYRWLNPAYSKVFMAHIFKKMSAVLKLFVPALVRRGVRKQLYEQGMGRHSEAEIIELGKQDIDAVVTMLGTQEFLFGDQPSSYDAVVFAFMTMLLGPPIEMPLKTYAALFPVVTDYCERMRLMLFPDLTPR
jgi:glutathione S-transferase